MRFHRPLLALAVGLTAAGSSGSAGAQTVTFEEETEPFPGVRILERHTTGPDQRIHVAFVAMCEGGVEVTAADAGGSKRTASSFGSATGVQLAVNGDFYRTDTSTPVVYGDAVGPAGRWPTGQTGRGSEFSDQWYYQDYGWIAVGDGWVDYTYSGYVKKNLDTFAVSGGWSPTEITSDIPPGTRALVSGFPQLVVEGTAYSDFPDRSDTSARHPRTAMGLSKDRKTLILAAIDGRSSVADGMTGAELATLMHEMGAWNAFNLDGGGSTQMWLDGGGTINSPSDGSPRSVANHWGVFAAGVGDAANCFQAGGCYPATIPDTDDSAFGDMPTSDKAYDAALALYEADIARGCGGQGDYFCPKCDITRRDVAVMLARAAGLNLEEIFDTPSFADVAMDDPDYAAIEAVTRAGFALGCIDGSFCPDASLTRGEVAFWVARAAGIDSSDKDVLFADYTEGVGAAAAAALRRECVVAGCGEDGYCPDRVVKRSTAAVIVARAFNLSDRLSCEQPEDETGAPAADQGGLIGGCAAAAGGAPLPGLVLLGLWLAIVSWRRGRDSRGRRAERGADDRPAASG